MHHIISLGAGVQSSTMALMAAHGEIMPMPTCAIFADTHAEPNSVYRWLEFLEVQLPFPIHRVSNGSLTHRTLSIRTNRKTGNDYYSNQIPAFMLNPDGSHGQVSRHCTYDYKILPIRKAVRSIAGIKRGQATVGVIQWIGISLDEIRRMKPSRDPWSEFRWPLIDMRMTRRHCLDWMRLRGYPEPPRSACVYCPYHHDTEWRRLKSDEPDAFTEAVRVERELQKLHGGITVNGKINGTPFLNSRCKPLDTIDFSSDTDRGQLMLWDDECDGVCGV